MFDFQRHFTLREPLALPLTLNVDGDIYMLDDPESVTEFAEKYFTRQSWLERKYMSFRLVDAHHLPECLRRGVNVRADRQGRFRVSPPSMKP